MDDRNRSLGRLIIDRQSPALKEALWRLVRDAKQEGGALAPATVVGPSQYANLSLRQELGRSGFANVRFILLPMLAEMLGGATMATEGRRPLTPTLEAVLARRTLDQAEGLLAGVKQHSATLNGVRQSFRQLRRAPGTVVDELERSGASRREVIRLYRIFRQAYASGWYDQEDLAEAAADAVDSDAAPALPDLGEIIFYLPRDLSPGQVRLVQSLCRRGVCHAVLGATGDELADGPLWELAGSLRPLLADSGERFTDSSALEETRLHVASDAHEELRQVIRQVMANAADGMPLHRMAVLYGADRPYGSLVREEFELAGIPVAGPGQKTLGETAAGRTLLGLLRLSASLNTEHPLRRDEVMGWLTGCPIRTPSGLRREEFSPAAWDAISRRAGVIAGINQWRARLGAYADWLAQYRVDAETEQDNGRLQQMNSEAASARSLLNFIERLAADIAPAGSSAASGYLSNSWEGYCDWAEGLMTRYVDGWSAGDGYGEEESWPSGTSHWREEEDARERIRGVMAELRVLDSFYGTNPAGFAGGSGRFGQGATLSEFRQSLEESLRRPVGHLGETGRGVFVSGISSAAGMSFDIVWIVGMIEGDVPPRVHDDPLLPEPAWREAGGQSRIASRAAKERYDFLTALASASRRVLSHPVADPGSRRRAFPSRWLLEQASLVAAAPVYAEDLPKLKEISALTSSESLEGSILGVETPADLHDYNLNRLLLWRREGQDFPAHPLASQGLLKRSLLVNRARVGGAFSEFDGNLSSVAALRQAQEGASSDSSLRLDPFASPVSATSLERWAVCPFRYFLHNLLGLSSLNDPEEAVSISPMDRGLLVHRILEKFFSEAQLSGRLPAAGQSWDGAQRLRLKEIANSIFDEFESRGMSGKPLLWELGKRSITEDLERLLEEDAGLRERHATASVMTEVRFGPGQAWPEAVLSLNSDGNGDGETGIRFRGAIDRVDFREDGSPALIVDYKTGSRNPYRGLDDDPGSELRGGRHLQLAVYSLAARNVEMGLRAGSDGSTLRQAQDSPVRAAYWFATGGGGFRFSPGEPLDINDPAALDAFREGVASIADGIRKGVYPANPGSGSGPDGSPANCSYCDFNSLCPSRRQQLWERKKGDPLLSGFRSLSATAEAPETGNGNVQC